MQKSRGLKWNSLDFRKQLIPMWGQVPPESKGLWWKREMGLHCSRVGSDPPGGRRPHHRGSGGCKLPWGLQGQVSCGSLWWVRVLGGQREVHLYTAQNEWGKSSHLPGSASTHKHCPFHQGEHFFGITSPISTNSPTFKALTILRNLSPRKSSH